jgi:hypothetical protein
LKVRIQTGLESLTDLPGLARSENEQEELLPLVAVSNHVKLGKFGRRGLWHISIIAEGIHSLHPMDR